MFPGEKAYIAPGHPNRRGEKLTALKAIIIHYTGNEAPGADAKMNANYFGRSFDKGTYWDFDTESFKEGFLQHGSIGQGQHGLGMAFDLNSNGPYELGKFWNGKAVTAGKIMRGTKGKAPSPVLIGTVFAYGSAQVIADMNTVLETMPLDEVAWGCGDRRLPYDDLNKGQQPAARLIFGNKQNYQTLSVEICNNDAIKGSNKDWLGAVKNGGDWVVAFLKDRKLKIDLAQSLDPNKFTALKPGEILILRHFDVTGKICPKPFVDDAAAWKAFVQDLAARANV